MYDTLSAQVAVRPECSGELDAVMQQFQNAGFTTAAPFAGSFSIGGPRSLFESYFGTAVPAGTSVVPLHALPGELREKVAAVVFSAIDFGPVSY
jgi:hypothetical protein